MFKSYVIFDIFRVSCSIRTVFLLAVICVVSRCTKTRLIIGDVIVQEGGVVSLDSRRGDEQNGVGRLADPDADIHNIIIDCSTMGYIDWTGMNMFSQVGDGKNTKFVKENRNQLNISQVSHVQFFLLTTGHI